MSRGPGLVEFRPRAPNAAGHRVRGGGEAAWGRGRKELGICTYNLHAFSEKHPGPWIIPHIPLSFRYDSPIIHEYCLSKLYHFFLRMKVQSTCAGDGRIIPGGSLRLSLANPMSPPVSPGARGEGRERS